MARVLACVLRDPRGKAGRKGTTAIEFALLAGPFFLLIIGVIELSLMMGAQQMLESAAYNTSRLAKTGYVTTGQTQMQTVSQILVDELSAYGNMIDTSKVTMTSTSYSSFAAAGSGTGGVTGMGGQQQIVVYTVSYSWKLFTPMLAQLMGSGGIVPLTATIVVRNEPYG